MPKSQNTKTKRRVRRPRAQYSNAVTPAAVPTQMAGPLSAISSFLPNQSIAVNAGLVNYENLKALRKYNPAWAEEEEKKYWAWAEVGRKWLRKNPKLAAQIGGDDLNHQMWLGQVAKQIAPLKDVLFQVDTVVRENPNIGRYFSLAQINNNEGHNYGGVQAQEQAQQAAENPEEE